MATTSQEIAEKFNNITGTIATIRADYKLACPNGFVCELNREVECSEVRDLFRDPNRLGMGDIMAGIWCPNDNSTLRNCPVGYYCPTPDNRTICPAGKFCPHKTLMPEIDCPRCPEGSETLVFNITGVYVFYLCLLLVVLYILVTLAMRYWTNQQYKLSMIEKRTLDPFKRLNIFDQREKRMKRIRPVLENLAKRLEDNKIGTKKVKNDILKIPEEESTHFQSQALRGLFNALDKDDDGFLSYNDFNVLLGMNQVQLQQFVGEMNSRAGLDYETKVLSRAVFVRYFLPVLENTSHLSPSEEDAQALFDEMAKYERENNKALLNRPFSDQGKQEKDTDDDDDHVEIRFETFREEDFFHFLSQQQTNDLMKRFRWLRKQQTDAVAKAEEAKEAKKPEKPAPQRGRRRSLMMGGGFNREQSARTLMGGGFAREASSRGGLTIGREEFVKNYPKLLKEVVSTNAPRRQSTDVGGMTGGIDEFLTIDITFENLSLYVELAGKRADIVDSVTGRLRAQTMTALMGGSGAGKTSLLNALCGRAFYGTVEGKIWINGIEASIEDHKDAVGFVPQDDTVYAELTVKENLIYSGRFRSERGTDPIEIEDYADSTLAKLGLSRVANTIVGDVHRRGVSGGEKKRVNIGVELMGQPSIIFLDEPTSGLDASSALLVMKSLKKLVTTNGVTICAVIHQPRKVIYDLFDSLILLSVGGKMCFHGPTENAQFYFEEKGYKLPEGESVADWLIDISSGQLAPDADGPIETNKPTERELGEGGGTAAVSNLQEEESDVQALRREELANGWKEYFLKKNRNISKKSRQKFYEKPPATYLPEEILKPSFWGQFWVQLHRAMKVGKRNYFYKFVDTSIIVFVGVLISYLQGETILSTDADPSGIRLKYLVDKDPALILSEDNDDFFEQLFRYAVEPNEDFRQYGLKVGVILAVIVGLSATKMMTEKRVEFFRESGSGYDVNAYFLAVNLVTTVEHSVQLFLVSLASFWLRDSVVSRASYYVSFLMLAWLTVGWSLLLAVIVPPASIFSIVGFFMALTGMLFSGASPPILYDLIYEKEYVALFCGFFSPTRYFTEGLAVSEHRCLPPQSGFTTENAPNFPSDKTSFAILGLGLNDSHATDRNCDGWFWYVLPAFMVGFTVRFIAGGLIHVVGRTQQAKQPLLKEMASELRSYGPKTTVFLFSCYMIILVGLLTVSAWLMLRQV